MHESYTFYDIKLLSIIFHEIYWVWIIESDVKAGVGEGPHELPPSHGWPYSVENKLFSKQREVHSSILL